MNFFIELIKVVIYLLFPILIYLYFENLNYKKNLKHFLKISLFCSSLLFSFFNNNYYLSILVNIPLIIAYLKKYTGTYIIINIVIILYLYFEFNVSFLFLLIEYMILIISLSLFKSKINIFSFLISYFYSFSIFYYYNFSIISIHSLKILFMIIFSYLLAFSLKYMVVLYKNKYSILEEEYNGYLFKFIHEVKNPIAVCKGYLEIINNKNNISKKNLNSYLTIIDKEINESLNIMEDYLILGRYKVNLEYIDINLLLQDVISNFEGLFKENGICINFDCDIDEIIILGDYTKLKQVFVNIIKNSVEAKAHDISINLTIKNGTVFVGIEDNGIGIKEVEKVGSKFYTTKTNGNGLGINFCKTIISLHNGDIKYKSNNNSGTYVYISIPLVNIY